MPHHQRHFTITHSPTFTYSYLFIYPLLYTLTLQFLHPHLSFILTFLLPNFFTIKNCYFLFHSIHILPIQKGEYSLSLSLSIYIYIFSFGGFLIFQIDEFLYLTLIQVDMIWLYFNFFYLFNFIFFVCYMLSYEITEWLLFYYIA